jgi:iron complex outermembrane receptor protein
LFPPGFIPVLSWNDMSRFPLFSPLSGKTLRAGFLPCLLLALPVQAADDDALALPATAISQTQAAEPDLHTQVATGSRLNFAPPP